MGCCCLNMGYHGCADSRSGAVRLGAGRSAPDGWRTGQETTTLSATREANPGGCVACLAPGHVPALHCKSAFCGPNPPRRHGHTLAVPLFPPTPPGHGLSRAIRQPDSESARGKILLDRAPYRCVPRTTSDCHQESKSACTLLWIVLSRLSNLRGPLRSVVCRAQPFAVVCVLPSCTTVRLTTADLGFFFFFFRCLFNRLLC